MKFYPEFLKNIVRLDIYFKIDEKYYPLSTKFLFCFLFIFFYYFFLNVPLLFVPAVKKELISNVSIFSSVEGSFFSGYISSLIFSSTTLQFLNSSGYVSFEDEKNNKKIEKVTNGLFSFFSVVYCFLLCWRYVSKIPNLFLNFYAVKLFILYYIQLLSGNYILYHADQQISKNTFFKSSSLLFFCNLLSIFANGIYSFSKTEKGLVQLIQTYGLFSKETAYSNNNSFLNLSITCLMIPFIFHLELSKCSFYIQDSRAVYKRKYPLDLMYTSTTPLLLLSYALSFIRNSIHFFDNDSLLLSYFNPFNIFSKILNAVSTKNKNIHVFFGKLALSPKTFILEYFFSIIVYSIITTTMSYLWLHNSNISPMFLYTQLSANKYSIVGVRPAKQEMLRYLTTKLEQASILSGIILGIISANLNFLGVLFSNLDGANLFLLVYFFKNQLKSICESEEEYKKYFPRL